MGIFSSSIKNYRIGTPDLLKGIAVLLMIQVHITELFAIPEIYYSTFGKISLFLGGPPAAPLFMILMGYFIGRTKKSDKDLFFRGIKLFIGGIILNIGLNFNLLVSYFTGRFEFSVNPFEYIFGVDILLLAGMSFVIISLIKKYFDKYPPAYFLLAVIVAAIVPYLEKFGTDQNPFLMYLNAFLWGDYEWSYFPLFPWLAYPLVGAGLFKLKEKYSDIKIVSSVKYILLFIWAGIIIFTLDYGINIASDLNSYYHHSILYFLWTIFFLSGFSYLFYLLEITFTNNSILIYLKWIGQNVTAAYVFQWLLIGNIATEIFKTQNYYQIILWFWVITFLTTLFIIIYKKYFSDFTKIFDLKNVIDYLKS